MKKISIKTLALSVITCSILTGCANNDDFATPKDPSKEIITVLNVEPISKDYIDYRVNKINSKYYEKDFIQKEIAGQEEEMGIYTLNKNKNKNHKIEKIASDEFDNVTMGTTNVLKNNAEILAKNTNKSPIQNPNTVLNKNPNTVLNKNQNTVQKTVVNNKSVNPNTVQKTTVTEVKPLVPSTVKEVVMDNKTQPVQSSALANNKIKPTTVSTQRPTSLAKTNDDILSTKNLTKKEREKLDVLVKVYEQEFPFLIEINGDYDFINDLKTGQEYVIALSDNNVSVFEKTNNNYYKEIQMFTKKIYEYMQSNKTENNYMRVVEAKELEKFVRINFIYKNGTLTFYNNKFKKVISLDEELEINNNGTNVKLKIDNSLVNFNSTEQRIKKIITQ